MNTMTDRLRAVQERVDRLVRDHHALRARATELEIAGLDHLRTNEVLTARVSELERENEVLRRIKPATSGTTDPGTKDKIDALVNEIDRCLSLIKN